MGLEAAAVAALPILIGAAAWTGYTQYRSAEEAKEAAKKTSKRQEALASEQKRRRELEERQAAMQLLRRRQRALLALQGGADVRDSSALGALFGAIGGPPSAGKGLLGQ